MPFSEKMGTVSPTPVPKDNHVGQIAKLSARSNGRCMIRAASNHSTSLQHQVRRRRTGYRDIDRLLPLLGEFQKAIIQHRQPLARMGVPARKILQHQNVGITELRAHDPDFGNTAKRIGESVAKRVNDAYTRAFTVRGRTVPKNTLASRLQDVAIL